MDIGQTLMYNVEYVFIMNLSNHLRIRCIYTKSSNNSYFADSLILRFQMNADAMRQSAYPKVVWLRNAVIPSPMKAVAQTEPS